MAIKASPYSDPELFTPRTQRTFRGRELLQIALPIGGIGAGCVSLNGQGGLQDFAVRNTPAISAMADGHYPVDCAFATLYLPDQGIARLLEGPMPRERIYDQGLKGQGYRAGGHEGLPRLRKAAFKGEYPFGEVRLSDPAIPLAVTITGFNPFIPLDDRNSSLPCAILEYTFHNLSKETQVFEFGYHLSHFAFEMGSYNYTKTRNTLLPGVGASLYNLEDPDSASFGSCALGMIGHTPQVKAMWFRGGWFDSLSALWREISTGTFTSNNGEKAATSQGRNGASILIRHELAPGAEVTFPVVISWHFPNVHYAYGELKPIEGQDVASFAEHGDGLAGAACQSRPPRWRPYYASQWKDAAEVLLYVREQYSSLRKRTQAFHDALFRSSLPGYVLDAVSANLAILKSPTVLRQFNGNLWAWEGCFCNSGCCHGSCTHVWNYTQAIPHLFPALERTFREQELWRSMDERGHVTFRAALPDGPAPHGFHPASDGQLGGIMKVYRDWQVSGDRNWLEEIYPDVKQSMDFSIDYWDPDHLGVLVEPHHNTYDIEFWGPDGMCSSFYLGALAAMSSLARDAGHPADAPLYEELAAKGARYLDEQLFNGEYYEQKFQLKGLRASPSDADLERIRQDNPEEYALLMSEGPKYQYGTGCISDGVFGAWLAKSCGVNTPQNQANIRKNLKAIFDYNFRASLWEHANPQRPGYAIGDEPGLLLCTWPRGAKPTLPFVYSDEVWTGIEYQAASHMIAEGWLREGLSVVKALRDRFDGLARNPWNEYECGNFYARAMASYGLLIALSGFRYSAPEKTLWLEPRLPAEDKPLEIFFSTASAWGTLVLHGRKLTLRLEEGTLAVDTLVITLDGQTTRVEAGLQAAAGKRNVITF